MKTVGYVTLGCKTNQYDTQCIREAFENSGYASASFQDFCDIYVINTCTVTETGDKKSLKMIRQAARKNPQADIIVTGCLAQKDAKEVCLPGVRLVLGNHFRQNVVALYEQALQSKVTTLAVTDLTSVPYEETQVTSNEGHTRAVMKIQEGCDNFCAYCIIPSVRGSIRSRSLEGIFQEASRLVQAGFQEIVLTGIHLSSYGRERNDGTDLVDAIKVVAQSGIRRIRLGSLEPRLVDASFVERMEKIKAICPQFHLSLQSGCDEVLKNMHRQYTTRQFEEAVSLLRNAFPYAAITTDIITGFPGETESQFEETLAFAKKIGFSRLHVFPYSERSGTEAAKMTNQIPISVREVRAKRLIAVGKEMEKAYQEKLLGQEVEVLFEEGGTGYAKEYIRVHVPNACDGQVGRVLLTGVLEHYCEGKLCI